MVRPPALGSRSASKFRGVSGRGKKVLALQKVKRRKSLKSAGNRPKRPYSTDFDSAAERFSENGEIRSSFHSQRLQVASARLSIWHPITANFRPFLRVKLDTHPQLSADFSWASTPCTRAHTMYTVLRKLKAPRSRLCCVFCALDHLKRFGPNLNLCISSATELGEL